MSFFHEITPQLYFGSATASWDPALMAPITHVINCDVSPGSSSFECRTKNLLHLKSLDDETFPILDIHLPTALRYIDHALKNPFNKVFIQGYNGINRSAALTVAYLCEVTGSPATAVIDAVRQETRRLLLTNMGFVEQLRARYPSPI